MSIDSARVVCTGCDYETREFFALIRIRYQTASGKYVETGRAKGWCYDCASYSNIESMNQSEFVDELFSKEREKKEVLNRQDELSRGFFSKFRHQSENRQLRTKLEWLDREITKLNELIEISKRRKSKARCLKCWSDRTAPIKFSSEDNVTHEFQHECGGKLKIIYDHSGPRFLFRISTFILNEEGEFLGKE